MSSRVTTASFVTLFLSIESHIPPSSHLTFFCELLLCSYYMVDQCICQLYHQADLAKMVLFQLNIEKHVHRELPQFRIYTFCSLLLRNRLSEDWRFLIGQLLQILQQDISNPLLFHQ